MLTDSLHESTLSSLDHVIMMIREQTHCHLGVESVKLATALGRLLAEDIISPVSLPPYDNTAVDGYGICSADSVGSSRRVVDSLNAGMFTERSLGQGEAIRLFTGAPLPLGVDAVVMQEKCVRDGDWITIPTNVKPGTNCRWAGEDIGYGRLALTTGTRLRPQELGLIAAMGLTTLLVRVPLRVALFSTGNELREPGVFLPPGCIHDANRYAVAGLLMALGCSVTDFGILPDQVTDITAAMQNATLNHDLIVTSGGMSVGEEDHIKTAVATLGTLHVCGIKIKPGKPVAIGSVANIPFLGLPGNPVAAMVTFLLIGRPLVLSLSGRRTILPAVYSVSAGFTLNRLPGRREFLRACLNTNSNGILQVVPFQRQGSAILSSMAIADGLIDLSEATQQVKLGDSVRFLSFADLLW